MKILNLFAGVGGNRKLWDGHEITSVESDPKIASVYQKLNPNDTVIVADAYLFLIENYKDFDFIWSSPPCQSHSKMMKATRHDIAKYPDFRLYETIVFLQNFYKGKWVVENVVPYYAPLIEPTKRIGRHLFWSNFHFEAENIESPKGFINKSNLEGKKSLMNWLGIHYEESLYYKGNHCPAQVLRNCVHPLIGKQILDSAQNAV